MFSSLSSTVLCSLVQMVKASFYWGLHPEFGRPRNIKKGTLYFCGVFFFIKSLGNVPSAKWTLGMKASQTFFLMITSYLFSLQPSMSRLKVWANNSLSLWEYFKFLRAEGNATWPSPSVDGSGTSHIFPAEQLAWPLAIHWHMKVSAVQWTKQGAWAYFKEVSGEAILI